MTPRVIRWIAAAVPATFIGGLFLWPLARILATTLDGDSLGDVLTDRSIGAAAWFTVWQATASTVLTILAALPLTAVVARYRFAGRRLVLAATTVPFVLPTVVVGVAFLSLGLRDSVAAILAAHVFYNLAVVVRTVSGSWSRLDPTLVASARMLGASHFRAFREVTLPLLRPSILAAAAIVFLFSFSSFGVVLILGGLRYRTIEVEIYQQAFTFLDLGAAGGLAVLQLIGVGATLWWYGRTQRRGAVQQSLVPESDALQKPRTRRQRSIVAIVVGSTLGLQLTPLVVLVARSFQSGGAGWRFLADPGRLAIEPLSAIGNSLRFAGVATVISLVIGGMAALVVASGTTRFAETFDMVLMLPLGTSAVTIGLGFLVALGDFRTSWWLVPLAHSLVAVPFVVRTMVPTLRSVRQEIRDAATMLGASPARVWREIDLPIVSRAALVGAGFAAAISLGEFGATTFIARPATTTLPTLIFRFLARPGSTTYAAALASAVLLMVVTALLILAVDRLRADDLGTF